MARNHARILTSIWTDEDFIGLEPEAQRVYLLLVSQPDLTPCGALPYLPRRWARLSALVTEQEIVNAISLLEEARYVVVDRDTDELVIRTYVVHDGGLGNPKMRGAVKSALRALHSLRLRAVIVDVIPDPHRVEIADGLPIERQSNVDPIPVPAVVGLPMGLNAEVGGRRHEQCSSSSSAPGLALVAEPPDPDPPKKPKPVRGTRVPDPFDVSDDMEAWVKDRCPGLDWERETEKFVNYWTAASGRTATKLDWVAAWRTWMLDKPGYRR